MKNKKSLWGIGLTVTFILFAAGILTLAAFSASSEFDFVSKSYYEDSLTYQEVIDAENRAFSLEKAPKIRLDGRTLSVLIPPSLQVNNCTLELYSPKSSQEDRTYKVESTTVSLDELRSGRWKATLRWTGADKETYIIKQPLEIPR